MDYGLYYVWAYASLFAKEWWPRTEEEVQNWMAYYPTLQQGIQEMAQDVGENELVVALAQLPVLVVSASSYSWQQQADRLFELLKQRDLAHVWNFNDEQFNKLNQYLAANELLVQCLKVAVVSNREGILDGLLAPPKPNKVTV